MIVNMPLHRMARVAYYYSVENDNVEFEAPDDSPYIDEFNALESDESIENLVAQNVDHGEWGGDRLDVVARLDLPETDATAVLDMDLYENYGELNGYTLIQFET